MLVNAYIIMTLKPDSQQSWPGLWENSVCGSEERWTLGWDRQCGSQQTTEQLRTESVCVVCTLQFTKCWNRSAVQWSTSRQLSRKPSRPTAKNLSSRRRPSNTASHCSRLFRKYVMLSAACHDHGAGYI